MIKQINLILLLILPSVIYSQDFRVKTIKHIIQNHVGKGRTDSIQKDFHYKDSILDKITITQRSLDCQNSSVQSVIYDSAKIKIGNKTFLFDSKNRITDYISNGYGYRFKYDNRDRPVVIVRDSDTLGLKYFNQNNRLKKTIDSIIVPAMSLNDNDVVYKYTYTSQENILTAISNRTGGLWVNYRIDHAPYFMVINGNQDGRIHFIHEFYYDTKGLLIKELIKVFAPKLIATHTIFIDYENVAGNEDFLFKTYNWRYNFYLGVETFYESIDARY